MPELKSHFEEHFCKLIALENKTGHDAQIEAYPTSIKWSDNAINVQASKRMRKPNMILRIDELKAQITAKAIEKASFTLEDAIKQLKEACEMSKTREEANNLIKGTVELAKLAGVYEEALKLKGDKENPIEHNIEVKFI